VEVLWLLLLGLSARRKKGAYKQEKD